MWVGQVELAEVPGPAHRGPLATEAVEAGVDDDAVQPCRDGGVPPVGLGPPERRDERLLNGIRGELGPGGGAQGNGVHPVPVAPEELAEGGPTVTRHVPLQEVTVTQG